MNEFSSSSDVRLPHLCDEVPEYALPLAIAYQKIMRSDVRPTLRELVFSWQAASSKAPLKLPPSQYPHYRYETFTSPENEDWCAVREYRADQYSILQLASARQHYFLCVHDLIPSALATWFELMPRPPRTPETRRNFPNRGEHSIQIWIPFKARQSLNS